MCRRQCVIHHSFLRYKYVLTLASGVTHQDIIDWRRTQEARGTVSWIPYNSFKCWCFYFLDSITGVSWTLIFDCSSVNGPRQMMTRAMIDRRWINEAITIRLKVAGRKQGNSKGHEHLSCGHVLALDVCQSFEGITRYLNLSDSRKRFYFFQT